MDQKTAKKLIDDRRAEGKTDQQVYNELSQHYDNKKNLALLITGTASVQARDEYKLYNNVLIALLGVTLLFRLIGIFSLVSEGGILGLVVSLVGILLPALFIYGFINYMGPMYKLCGFLTVLGIVQLVARGNFDVLVMVDLVILVTMAFLSFYLGSRMFPKFNPGKLRKDENGGYLLN
ncbi:MAG: hypothetical protein EOO09_17355 [Chitinophagaceae bacterium]|nr:MAG: hypothetical protein EOO09_17355 [Chitinophagaceae bacterium]